MKKQTFNGISFSVLCGCYLIMAIIKLSSSIIMPVFQQKFDLSSSEMGLISSMFFIAFAFMQIITGPLCRKFGPYKVVGLGMTVGVFGLLLFGFATKPFLLYVGRFLQGVGLGPTFIGVVYFLQCHYTDRKYVQLTGIAIMVCGIGSAISGAPLNFLVETLGSSGVFILLAGVGLFLVFLVVICGFKDKDIFCGSLDNPGSVLAQIKEGLGIIKTNTAVRCGFILWFLYNAVQITYQGLWSAKWFRLVFPVYSSWAGLSSTVASIGLTLSCILSDYITNRRIPRTLYLFRIGMGLFVSIGLFTLVKSFECGEACLVVILVSFVIDFVYGFMTGHTCVQISAVIKEHTDTKINATVVGIANCASGLVSQTLQWLSGVSIDLISPVKGQKTAYSLTFVLVFLIFGCGISYCRRLRKQA